MRQRARARRKRNLLLGAAFSAGEEKKKRAPGEIADRILCRARSRLSLVRLVAEIRVNETRTRNARALKPASAAASRRLANFESIVACASFDSTQKCDRRGAFAS